MFKEIAVNELSVSDLNVRKSELTGIDILADNIKELALKFKSDGLIHPLTVRKVGKVFQVIAGQRRLKAIQLINSTEQIIKKVKCLVVSGKKDVDVLISLSENSFTQTMTPIERYNAYALLKSKGYSVGKIAMAFGTSSTKVNQALAIADLHDDVLALYQDNKIRDEVLFHLTKLSHEQQLRITTEISDGDSNFGGANSVDSYLERTEINASHALFNLADSGIAIETDLFNDKTFVTDYVKFMDLQREAIGDLLGDDANSNTRAMFIDCGQNVSLWRYDEIEPFDEDDEPTPEELACFEKDMNESCKIYSLLKSGEVLIRYFKMDDDEAYDFYNELTRENSKVDDDSDDNDSDDESGDVVQSSESEVDNKPKRQELTKNDQNYFKDWQHLMASHKLLKNPDYAVRFLLARMICGIGASFERLQYKRVTKDEQLNGTVALAEIKALLEPFGNLMEQQYGNKFDDVFEMVGKMTDDEVKNLMVAVSVASLAPRMDMVKKVGVDLNINSLDYWHADAGFIDSLNTNPALIAVGSELIKYQEEFESFSKLSMKDKKVKLNSLISAEYLPKYLNWPLENYTGVELDIQSSNWF